MGSNLGQLSSTALKRRLCDLERHTEEHRAIMAELNRRHPDRSRLTVVKGRAVYWRKTK